MQLLTYKNKLYKLFSLSSFRILYLYAYRPRRSLNVHRSLTVIRTSRIVLSFLSGMGLANLTLIPNIFFFYLFLVFNYFFNFLKNTSEHYEELLYRFNLSLFNLFLCFYLLCLKKLGSIIMKYLNKLLNKFYFKGYAIGWWRLKHIHLPVIIL